MPVAWERRDLGPGRALVTLPARWHDTWSDLWIEADYLGSSADLLVDDEKKTDHLLYGPPWVVGAKRFMPAAATDGIEFRVQPWRAGISGVDPEREKLVLSAGPSAAVIRSIRVWPEYRVEVAL